MKAWPSIAMVMSPVPSQLRFDAAICTVGAPPPSAEAKSDCPEVDPFSKSSVEITPVPPPHAETTAAATKERHPLIRGILDDCLVMMLRRVSGGIMSRPAGRQWSDGSS